VAGSIFSHDDARIACLGSAMNDGRDGDSRARHLPEGMNDVSLTLSEQR
jgi:hypothetical protein